MTEPDFLKKNPNLGFIKPTGPKLASKLNFFKFYETKGNTGEMVVDIPILDTRSSCAQIKKTKKQSIEVPVAVKIKCCFLLNKSRRKT